jgi:hypothetical protein
LKSKWNLATCKTHDFRQRVSDLRPLGDLSRRPRREPGRNWSATTIAARCDVTTDLQAFALIVTAEPYYAVRQPSNVVVLENVVREDTKGTTKRSNAKYELMERGGYIPTGYKFDPVVLNANLPLEFFEARNALRIAQSEGAEQYASDSYQHAVKLMNNSR